MGNGKNLDKRYERPYVGPRGTITSYFAPQESRSSALVAKKTPVSLRTQLDRIT